MCYSLRNSLQSLKHLIPANISPIQKSYGLQNPLHLFLRFIGTSTMELEEHPCAVSFLINSCRLSLEEARSASKSVSFKSTKTADSVIKLFQTQGFSETEISYLVKRMPRVLTLHAERNIRPKLDFLSSKGITRSLIGRFLSLSPWVLMKNLEKHIIPTFDFYRKLLRSDAKTISTIKRYPGLLSMNVYTEVLPRMKIFADTGVSEENFGLWLYCQPRHVKVPPDRLRENMEKVKQMGFDPSLVKFVIAVQVLGQLSPSSWEKKVEVYSRWGWSKEQISAAFKRSPWCMMISESKIMAVMNFYVNEMGVKSSYFLGCPTLLALSLKKRIIPRCSVLKALQAKGLTNKYSFSYALSMPEKAFLEKVVSRQGDESLHLLDLYNEKMGRR